jgi:hypothetical protein
LIAYEQASAAFAAEEGPKIRLEEKATFKEGDTRPGLVSVGGAYHVFIVLFIVMVFAVGEGLSSSLSQRV